VTGSGWEIERILRAARRAGRGGQPGRYRHRPGQGAVPGTRHKVRQTSETAA
jgi:hypothetical protein